MAKHAPITGAPDGARPFLNQSIPTISERIASIGIAAEFIDALAEAIEMAADETNRQAVALCELSAPITAAEHLTLVREGQRLSGALIRCLRTQVPIIEEALEGLERIPV